jgi:hypothetical protein
MMPRLHRASSRLFPLLVILAIISRVLVTSGLTAAAAGGESFYRWANTRLERFERLRMQAKREMAERRRGGRGPDAVELLYSEIMRSTTPGAP